jgi:hypothetical protein
MNQSSQFNDKRKWQIALRRYVLEQQMTSTYAPFFGLDISNFREWIQLQFINDMSWENFGKTWQLDHIVPVAYFDFQDLTDLKLCWNFLNIRVVSIDKSSRKETKIDVIAAKAYFSHLYHVTNLSFCQKILDKIDQIEKKQVKTNTILESFVMQKQEYITRIEHFSAYEFEQLNLRVSLEEVELQKNLSSRFA